MNRGHLLPPNPGRGWPAVIGQGALGLGALAIGILALLTGASIQRAEAQSCAGQFTLGFAGLPAGTILGEQYAGQGVHISGEANNNGPDALIVFDSNSTNTELDADLRVGIGNIAIFANNLDDEDADGLVDRPDENNYGGRAIFRFDQDVRIGSFKFVDKDHEPDDFAFAYDGSGNVIKQAAISPAGNGSVQTISINADGVRRFELVYGDSGGFTGIEVDCGQAPTPTATEVAETPTPAAPTPTAPAPTPTEAATPTPTEAASPAPTEAAGTPSPAVAAASQAPAAGVQAQPIAVLGENAPPLPGAAVAGAQALPAGGGSPSSAGPATWGIPLIVLGLLIGATLYVTATRRA